MFSKLREPLDSAGGRFWRVFQFLFLLSYGGKYEIESHFGRYSSWGGVPGGGGLDPSALKL